ncbi:MAG: endonuclease [Planctomycetes bacterium]|nr:endonuclease [Planctomycetota bacterium]
MSHSLRYFQAAVLLLTITVFMSAVVAGPYDPPANYYDTATGTGATLKSQLHNIIDNHTFFSYGDARSILQITDEDPNDPDRMLLVYNRVSLDVSVINPGGSIPGWDSGVSWNREHTWPRSRGVGTSGADNSDLHQLRPSDPGVNSSRSNLNFGGAFGQSFGSTFDGGTVWYPGDADAGMIARQEFYMAVRYDGSDTNTLDLELQSGNPASGDRFLGNLDRLLEWHYQAVPDDFELRRNDVIYDNYQGNRGPFVDRPEFVWSVFVDQQNDSQLYVDGAPGGDGGSTFAVELGPVLVGSAVPSDQNVTLNKNGFDGSYYEVTTTGDATSSVTGRYNAFAISASSTDSTTLSVGLNTTTGVAGQQSGSVVIDNLDVTLSGGAGRGANDADDTINVSLDVFDHAEASFAGASNQIFLTLDFGTVIQGSTLPTLDFDIFNLVNTAGFTADLELDSFLGTGDASILTTDLMTFTGATVTVIFRLPYWVYNPDATLEVTADYKGTVRECNEKNNTKTFKDRG